MSATTRLLELGIELPEPPSAAGAYVGAVRSGELLFTAGQLPLGPDGLLATGRVGSEIDLETARACARQCVLNLLAQVVLELGDLDRVRRIVKLSVFVASAPDFTAQPAVADGASELLAEIFGDAGRHVRSAVGVSVLPKDSPVEIEAIVEVAA